MGPLRVKHSSLLCKKTHLWHLTPLAPKLQKHLLVCQVNSMYFQLFSDDLYLDRTNLRLFKEILFDINAIKVDLSQKKLNTKRQCMLKISYKYSFYQMQIFEATRS